jgi:hypothetical protein
MNYLPPAGGPWEEAAPGALELDATALAGAVAFAERHPTPWEHDLQKVIAAGLFEEGQWNFEHSRRARAFKRIDPRFGRAGRADGA